MKKSSNSYRSHIFCVQIFTSLPVVISLIFRSLCLHLSSLNEKSFSSVALWLVGCWARPRFLANDFLCICIDNMGSILIVQFLALLAVYTRSERFDSGECDGKDPSISAKEEKMMADSESCRKGVKGWLRALLTPQGESKNTALPWVSAASVYEVNRSPHKRYLILSLFSSPHLSHPLHWFPDHLSHPV